MTLELVLLRRSIRASGQQMREKLWVRGLNGGWRQRTHAGVEEKIFVRGSVRAFIVRSISIRMLFVWTVSILTVIEAHPAIVVPWCRESSGSTGINPRIRWQMMEAAGIFVRNGRMFVVVGILTSFLGGNVRTSERAVGSRETTRGLI
jgi:hypothetical protein